MIRISKNSVSKVFLLYLTLAFFSGTTLKSIPDPRPQGLFSVTAPDGSGAGVILFDAQHRFLYTIIPGDFTRGHYVMPAPFMGQGWNWYQPDGFTGTQHFFLVGPGVRSGNTFLTWSPPAGGFPFCQGGFYRLEP